LIYKCMEWKILNFSRTIKEIYREAENDANGGIEQISILIC